MSVFDDKKYIVHHKQVVFMKIWKLIVHNSAVISLLLFTFSFNANALPLVQSEKSLIMESNGAKVKPCISKLAFWACPDDFTIPPPPSSIDIRIQALNGTFNNVHLESVSNNILVFTSVSPASCPTLKANQVCTFNIQNQNFSQQDQTGKVNVVADNKVFLTFTLTVETL